jgi:hypothetical protein
MPDRFDEAIDRAVREMLDVEPRADLRARVIAQLPASGSRRPVSGSRLPAAGWALAAAAVIVLAVFIARRSEPLPQGPVVATAVDRYLAPEAAPPRAVVQTPPRHVVPQAVGATGAGTVVAASFAGEDHATTAIEPLKTMTPIAVAPISQDNIAPAEIAVRPLNAIPELQIAPLTPPDRRN